MGLCGLNRTRWVMCKAWSLLAASGLSELMELELDSVGFAFVALVDSLRLVHTSMVHGLAPPLRHSQQTMNHGRQIY